MKKIGIITMYYNNFNYGGILQAFALCKKINDMGYHCEQISFERFVNRTVNVGSVKLLLQQRKFKLIIKKMRVVLKRCLCKILVYKLKERDNLFLEFINQIPHSLIFNKCNINQANSIYDTFVCGSDQIWNPNWWNDEYFLNFVKGGKKIAYAPSIGRSTLSEEETIYITDKLKSFDALSLREDTLIPMLVEKTGKEISYVLDPTMLISKSEYEELLTEPLIKENYLFVYLLGSNKKHKKMIKQIAKREKMKIVYIPYVGDYQIFDNLFGNIQMYSIGPKEFLNLIYNANCIFTDSFHCMVFSIIFEKNFFTLRRDNDTKKDSMNSRIDSLLDNFGLGNRIVNDIDDCSIHDDIDYILVNKQLVKLKNSSFEYLEKALRL